MTDFERQTGSIPGGLSVVLASFVAYVGCMIAANWMISHIGTVRVEGAWLMPVLPGVLAPSGVYFAGFSFAARDFVQRLGGRPLGIAAIFVGSGVSALTSNPRVAVASGVTFLFSETIDFLVYTPLATRRFVVAVVASGIVASFADSFLFLRLAGIPLGPALPGLLIGKFYAVGLGGTLAGALRSRLPVAGRTTIS